MESDSLLQSFFLEPVYTIEFSINPYRSKEYIIFFKNKHFKTFSFQSKNYIQQGLVEKAGVRTK